MAVKGRVNRKRKKYRQKLLVTQGVDLSARTAAVVASNNATPVASV